MGEGSEAWPLENLHETVSEAVRLVLRTDPGAFRTALESLATVEMPEALSDEARLWLVEARRLTSLSNRDRADAELCNRDPENIPWTAWDARAWNLSPTERAELGEVLWNLYRYLANEHFRRGVDNA